MEKKSITANVFMAAGALLIIGAFLPWISVSISLPGVGSTSGISGSAGFLVLAAGAVIGYVGFLRQQGKPVAKTWRVGSIVAAVLALLIGITNFSDVSDVKAILALAGATASVGIGLWLVILGAIAALVAIFVLAKKEDGANWWSAPAKDAQTWEPPTDSGM